MLKRVRLSSFKSVGGAVEVELGDLTLVAGANSSGKSTLLQGILLMHQTLSSKVTGRALVLNGPTVRLGAFDDVLAHGSRRLQFGIGIDVVPDEPTLPSGGGSRAGGANSARRAAQISLQEVSLDVSFRGSRRKRSSASGAADQTIRVSSVEMASDFLNAEKDLGRARIRVKPSNSKQLDSVSRFVGADVVKHLREALSFRPYLDATSRKAIKVDSPTAEPVGVNLDHFLPRSLAVQENLTLEGIGKSIDAVLQLTSKGGRGSEGRVTLPQPMVQTIRSSLPETVASRLLDVDDQEITIALWSERFLRLPAKDRSETLAQLRNHAKPLIESAYTIVEATHLRPHEYDIRTESLPSGLREGAELIDRFLSKKVRYLGPLRDEPRPVYPLSSSGDILDVGTKGEFTASVLNLNRDETVDYLSPANVAAGNYNAPMEHKPLLAAVEEWLRYLGVSDGVSTEEMGSRGHELRVRTTSKSYLDLTQVGVGVSQVLPIIVAGLVAPARSLTIFEQPELHLHPRVQTRLADFFVSMVHSHLQCLIETHSEYIINRLRLRAASSESGLHKKIKLYFVEQVDSQTRYRDVRISEFGTFTDWPIGFFDESHREAEAILRAGMAKRRKRKG
ncbi:MULTISPECIES: AAA family ATPase [unclassified Knoellia]|uniref:AAA family ATPase n=1 Tax=Knoellia altitudinis TaxID=3404795 RepID=UPI0036161437